MCQFLGRPTANMWNGMHTEPDSQDVTSVPPPKTMSMQGFQTSLDSSHNSPLSDGKTDDSLHRPLNEYFISSSHNTYLLEPLYRPLFVVAPGADHAHRQLRP